MQYVDITDRLSVCFPTPPIKQVDSRTFLFDIDICKANNQWDSIKNFIINNKIEELDGSYIPVILVRFIHKKTAMEFKLRFISRCL